MHKPLGTEFKVFEYVIDTHATPVMKRIEAWASTFNRATNEDVVYDNASPRCDESGIDHVHTCELDVW